MKKIILSALVIGLMTAGVATAQNGTPTTHPKHMKTKTEKVEKKTEVKKANQPVKEETKIASTKTKVKKSGKK